MNKYVVVEQAGYEGEQEVRTFNNYWRAIDWIVRQYGDVTNDNAEFYTLHVALRRDAADGTREYI